MTTVLTRREVETLQALADGMTQTEYAKSAHYARETIRSRLTDVRLKLGAPTSTRAVVLAVALGLVTVDGKRLVEDEVP